MNTSLTRRSFLRAAGGGFQHGQYLAYDPKDNKPLCNLYVAMPRQHGIDASKFASSKGTSLPDFPAAQMIAATLRRASFDLIDRRVPTTSRTSAPRRDL